jgi:cytosine/uracil/thiamine/allantoin permease
MNTAYSALTGLNVIIGLFSSLAVNMPDFGRFSKNNLAGGHQFLALPIIGTLGALCPICKCFYMILMTIELRSLTFTQLSHQRQKYFGAIISGSW